MKITQLASKPNLELAWRRITTGGNAQYKRLYRHVYYAYEVALAANLKDLRERLIGGSFQPQHPQRVFVPKASGLHRPLALLHIEDQIVLQAFANLAAKTIQRKRAPLQGKVVFSNILETPSSIFFFRRWQRTCRAFQRRIERQYASGLRWVGDFDLAAFYDTVSHELLLRTIYPRTKSADLEWMCSCLQTWSSHQAASRHGHGLPQGPLASDFLAECFLLPIDLVLQNRRGYTRYVDDVRLLGSTEDEVRADLIELERHCRERGLIPQSGKFAIRRAQSLREAMGMLPSISDPHHTGDGTKELDAESALRLLRSALSGRPYRVVDKTRLRYVLYRAQPDSGLLKLVLRIVPSHPEHADAFFVFLGRFEYRRPIEGLCLGLLEENPYAYVRGEAWHLLAKYAGVPRSATAANLASLAQKAVGIAKARETHNFSERWGACHFLCASESLTSTRHSRFLKHQPPLLQSLLAPALPDGSYEKGEVVASYLRRNTPEPGLSVCSELHTRMVSPKALGVPLGDVPSQVVNTLREIGLVAASSSRVDPIGEILGRRYKLSPDKSWHALLGLEYVHALGLLKQAEATFLSGRSFWLACQNSFNQSVFLALQRHLASIGSPAACKTVDRTGRLVDYGVTLDPNGPFSRAHPGIAGCFRDMNARRNRLPVSHPYEKKTAAQSRHLASRERDRFASRLCAAYAALQGLMP